MSPDIRVTGSMGLYKIIAPTSAGKRWRKKHLTSGERVLDSAGALVCDGGENCRAIVAGAVKDGLAVEVNGVDMKGFGS